MAQQRVEPRYLLLQAMALIDGTRPCQRGAVVADEGEPSPQQEEELTVNHAYLPGGGGGPAAVTSSSAITQGSSRAAAYHSASAGRPSTASR